MAVAEKIEEETELTAAARYAPSVRVMHWIVALLVLFILPVGVVIKFIAEPYKLTFYAIHESLGFLLLWVMLLRLLIRVTKRKPPEPWLSSWERSVSATVHTLLYVALIAQPIIGFLMTNAFGFPLDWFGIVTIPSPVTPDNVLGGWLKGVHIVLGYSILVLFLLHMAGVVHHHVLKRDPTLYRII